MLFRAMKTTVSSSAAVLFALSLSLNGQQSQVSGQAQPAILQPNLDRVRQSYVLGPNDQFQIQATDIEGFPGPYRIEADGLVNLPLVGNVKAAGLTVEAFETELIKRLKEFIRNPRLSVSVTQFRNEPVFCVGAFQAPGIYPLLGRRTLIEMTTAIGLQANASRRIRITRRAEFGRIPIATAVNDKENNVWLAEIGLGTQRDNINPNEDVELKPYDVITAERAEMIYVNGEVVRVGPVELGERSSISVSQAITMSGGLNNDANPEKVRVLRPILNTSRRAEIAVNLKDIMKGRANDFPLLPNDILYVPGSPSKVLWKTLAVALPVATIIGIALQ
ncbi:MAG TPA: polysaccharide biosynthesis/export family protein [Bryobacteraceae bacterium]|nr:polysaccharide biosynthesis/export family protein [Bryobacteraceae bacterium]